MLLTEKHCGTLWVRAFETRQEMGDCAGTEAADKLAELLREKQEVNVMFAAAPSQNEVLAYLRTRTDLDWGRVNAFHMDEYIGLAGSHPAGFGNFLRRSLFDHLPFGQVFYIDSQAADPQAECERYGALLKSHPLDLCILGVGENGHLAFNDPPEARFDDPQQARVVCLDQRSRIQQVNDGCFAQLEQVPEYAVTVTIPGLLAAQYMYCVVPCATKAQAIADMLSGTVTELCPASILTRKENARLYLDAQSAAGIL